MASSQMQKLKTLTKESDETLLATLLSSAESAVLRRLYPFNDDKTIVPQAYWTNVLEIAVYLYNKRGAEGETEHNEGDIERVYESGGVPPSMLRDIVPYAGVI